MTAHTGWRINRFLWLTLVAVAACLFVARSIGKLHTAWSAILVVLGIAFLNAVVRTLTAWCQGGYNKPLLAWLFNLIDIGLIALGVHLTGGLASDVWLLYFVLLGIEALSGQVSQFAFMLACIVVAYGSALAADSTSLAMWLTLAERGAALGLVSAFVRQVGLVREEKLRELALLREEVATSEERARIAREIHDSLGHTLTSCILQLELCKRLVEPKPLDAVQILEHEIASMRRAWSESRDLAFHLHPWGCDNMNTSMALRRHIGRFAERTGIEINLSSSPDDWSLPNATQLAFFRIVQEALTNVERHSEAKRVTIEVERSNGNLRCLIRDDGQGFDATTNSSGVGLVSMKERAKQLGGTLRLESQPGIGVSIDLRLPIHESGS